MSQKGYSMSVEYGARDTKTKVVPAKPYAEFDRFEQLTERLVSVPKREVGKGHKKP